MMRLHINIQLLIDLHHDTVSFGEYHATQQTFTINDQRFSAPGPFTCASTTSPICGTCRHGLGRYQEILKAKLIENTLRVAMANLRVIPLRRYCLLVTLTIVWNPSTSGESESFSTST